VYCPECGFHQSDAHRYCGRCGALLIVEGQTDEITGGFSLDEEEASGWAAAGVGGPALAVRSGGGLAGQLFPLDGARLTVGRSPSSDIFLDDVTVSRNHAVLSRGSDGIILLEDLGSLNGTYVNRRRIEAPERLEDGDELQIGKFRLAFIGG
jgi:hypothetical protein